MIRIFIVVGIVGVVVVSYLSTYGQGHDYQQSPAVSLLAKFEAEGVVPAANAVVENEEVEHGVFEVPPEDEVQLKKAMANSGGMGGMKMGGDAAKKPMDAEQMAAMPADNADAPKKPMDADQMAAMPADNAGAMAGSMTAEKVEGGLKITDDGAFDREINLTMAEWKFSEMKLDVKSGEKIRFTITNGGKIPHEFMFMTMPAMTAITYRARRADWSLLEHEALFEKSLVLPGGKFSFVAEIQENGVWMFMCMLPYHMAMGMMGQMATPGMAMDMNMNM